MKRKASSYLRCLISTFIAYKNKKVKLRIDNQDFPVEDYLVGTVSNGKIFGKGMKVAPQAKLDDGLFDVVLVKGMKAFQFFRNVWRIYTGTHLSHPKISLIRGKKVEAYPEEGEEDVLIELDGEQLGKLPATFEIITRNFLIKGTP
jgi:diacylglycerol kinase family enzyme